jgi:hypothetical protein
MSEKYRMIFLRAGSQSEFFTLKLMEMPIYEFSPYEQFSRNE